MKVRELQEQLTAHADDGRAADDEILVRVGKEWRRVDSSYSDGTFVLIAGGVAPHPTRDTR